MDEFPREYFADHYKIVLMVCPSSRSIPRDMPDFNACLIHIFCLETYSDVCYAGWMRSTTPRTARYTLDELQANADRSWVPDPWLIEAGLPDVAELVQRRVGPPIARSGPEVFIDVNLHDEAIGAEHGFSAQFLVVVAHRLDNSRPTIYIDRRAVSPHWIIGLFAFRAYTEAISDVYAFSPDIKASQEEENRRQHQVPGRTLHLMHRLHL